MGDSEFLSTSFAFEALHSRLVSLIELWCFSCRQRRQTFTDDLREPENHGLRPSPSAPLSKSQSCERGVTFDIAKPGSFAAV
jgi:hypothetical protein